ncbi:MAG: hypothetical protein HGA78_11320, partial [Nitrospirales bacterium]|nr:hypothetical protein [Nitrospirales bacterium]
MVEAQRMEDEINLLEYYNVLKKRKKLITTIVLVCVCLSVIISLLIPNIYQAKAVIAPVQPETPSGGASALLGSLGLTAPSSSITDVVALLNSNIIREKMIKKHNLLPLFLEKGVVAKAVADTIGVFGLSSEMTEDERMWNALGFLKDAMIVSYDDKASVINITMDFKDP